MSKKPSPEAEGAITAVETEARVLVACSFGEVNDVVILSAADAAAGVADGSLDTNADAVAYAKTLATEA